MELNCWNRDLYKIYKPNAWIMSLRLNMGGNVYFDIEDGVVTDFSISMHLMDFVDKAKLAVRWNFITSFIRAKNEFS